jgi:hypothetical protein
MHVVHQCKRLKTIILREFLLLTAEKCVHIRNGTFICEQLRGNTFHSNPDYQTGSSYILGSRNASCQRYEPDNHDSVFFTCGLLETHFEASASQLVLTEVSEETEIPSNL